MNADTIDTRESFRLSREMARARMPHLYRVARLFPEQERFDAFCALYASMRWVDDRVDEKQTDLGGLDAWEREINAAFSGGAPTSPFGPALADTLSRFPLTPEPWHRLLAAMRFDLQHDGFTTYEGFIRYAEGATVAPAALFASLLLMRPGGRTWRLALPYEEVRDAVRDAAVACYEVHILRDAQEDLSAGRNYFPQDELATYHLDLAGPLTDAWRSYLRAYGMRVRGTWQPAVAHMAAIESPMTDRERLMLHLLVEFYGESLQKIIRLRFDVWSDQHWPELHEITDLLERLSRQYEPGVDLGSLAGRIIEDV